MFAFVYEGHVRICGPDRPHLKVLFRGFGDRGLGFGSGVEGVGFRIWVLGLRIWETETQNPKSQTPGRVWETKTSPGRQRHLPSGFGVGVWGLGPGFGFQGSEFRVQGLGFWVWGLGFRRPELSLES